MAWTMMEQYNDVQITPNVGGDARIWAFQYKHVVTAYAVVSSRYVVIDRYAS